MTALEDAPKKKAAEQSAEQKAAVELVRLATEQGLSLTGPEGLLKQLTKTVLETALNEEMAEHLGYEKHDPPEAGSGNIRNGTRSKTVLTDTTGAVELDVRRDRASTFEPQIVKKRQRRLSRVDEVVLSLYAKGLTAGEISAHFAEIYGASVSKETISRITDKVIEEMNDWSAPPLDDRSRGTSTSIDPQASVVPSWIGFRCASCHFRIQPGRGGHSQVLGHLLIERGLDDVLVIALSKPPGPVSATPASGA